MAQAKKKTATKTAKKVTSTKAKSTASKKSCGRKGTSSRERMHVCIVTVLSMVTAIILCADAAIMLFS